MKSSLAFLVLACSIGALGLAVRSGPMPQALADACPSALEVTSSTINVNGQDIVQQVFACPDSNFTTIAAHDNSLEMRSFAVARSASECTTPATECQCGQSVGCGCYGDSTGPVASDCNALLASLPVVSSIQGPTFIIQPSTVHTTSLRTCAISFINLGSTPEEYCWDELASVPNQVSTCISQPSIADIVCMSSNQRFEIHMGATA